MRPDLAGQVAVVTGAGRGIGRAISMCLARAGATLVMTSRTEEELKSIAEEIDAEGGTSAYLPADVSVEQDVKALFAMVTDRFGRLDILVSNAGMGVFGQLAEVSVEDFDKVMSVNLRGTFLCCREAMQIMVPQARGYIINISSVVGFRGYANQSAYTASKHGVMGLTKSLAVEAQEHGIRVSAILPGGVDTELIRASRPDLDTSVLMQPEDIALTVEYLLCLPERAAVDAIYIRRSASKPF